jgi:hypothetical protein
MDLSLRKSNLGSRVKQILAVDLGGVWVLGNARELEWRLLFWPIIFNKHPTSFTVSNTRMNRFICY